MAKRGLLSLLAGSATVAAALGAVPAAALAAPAPVPAPHALAPLTSASALRLAQGPRQPVIVLLKSQAGPAAGLVPVTPAAASAARVIPDQAFTVPAPAPPPAVPPAAVPLTALPLSSGHLATGNRESPAPAERARPAALPPHAIPGACAAGNRSQLAPEGLALTSTAAGNPGAPTARSLGFTGAGVKVGYIADGLDPGNVNFRRANGTSVFAGYQDFTGNGAGASAGGGEAFPDASTIAGQGTHVYPVNGFSAQPVAGSACDIRIQGVAPGAALVGLDAFSSGQAAPLATTTSMIAQAINYAVETARVNVLNESFGGNPLPDSAQDVIEVFDDAAVRAGVVVSVASGDAGPASTTGSPATDPNVIAVGASTQSQALARANTGGTRYFATTVWLSDNISAFSSAGFDEAGRTVDLLSTATDLGAPAQEQGAGLLDSYQAVRLAQSYGVPRKTGSTLLTSPGQLTYAGPPGTARTWRVTVTNEGRRAQSVSLSARALSPATTTFASGAVPLSDSASGRYTADSGRPVNYATFKFRVPAGQGRLDVAIAYPANPVSVSLPPNLALFDPDGRVAADSEPQGVANYGNVDVRDPAAGQWTAVVSGYPAGAGGYNGKVVWQEATQDFTSFGAVSPASLSLAPGQAKSFTLAVTVPASPGDRAGSLLLHAGDGGVTSVPVVVRSLVDVPAGGRFAGDLTGGNGRGALGAGDYYQFTVPPGTKAVRAQLRLRDGEGGGNRIGAYLVGPDGNVLGYGQNSDRSSGQLGIAGPALTATALSPPAGTWTLIVAFAEPVAGTAVSDPYAGSVAFAAAGTAVPARPLPDGTALAPGRPVTVPVTITNSSNAPQDYFLDPRLDAAATMTLAPFVFGGRAPFAAGPAKTRLPVPAGAATSLYFGPAGTSSVTVRQASSVPAMTDLSTAAGGDPDVGPAGLTAGSLCGKSVSAAYAPPGGTVTSGAWAPAPTECGPYRAAAPAGTAADAVTVTAPGFDQAVTAATGDFEQLALSPAAGDAGLGKAVEVQPGHSATVNVTFTPAGRAGAAVRGPLYLDALQGDVPAHGQLAADQVAALPYSYTVR